MSKRNVLKLFRQCKIGATWYSNKTWKKMAFPSFMLSKRLGKHSLLPYLYYLNRELKGHNSKELSGASKWFVINVSNEQWIQARTHLKLKSSWDLDLDFGVLHVLICEYELAWTLVILVLLAHAYDTSH
jgi:hypothetical protein